MMTTSREIKNKFREYRKRNPERARVKRTAPHVGRFTYTRITGQAVCNGPHPASFGRSHKRKVSLTPMPWDDD